MNKILVTGASGHIGRLTLQNLIARKIPASQLTALVRDPAKAKDLSDLGIEVHQGDYLDEPSLLRAMVGVEKVVLVPTHAFTDRKKAHANVIDAAVKSGAKHILFMPIIRKPGSDFSMKEVTEEDLFTENRIIRSGMAYTFAKHPPFLNTLPPFFGPKFLDTGLFLPAGDGKVAAATREDLAEANGALLTQNGHENKVYSLSGCPAVSFAEMAKMISKITGKSISRATISEQEYISGLLAGGVPEFIAPYLLDWVNGISRGEWDVNSGDLEKLLGKPPTSAQKYFRMAFAPLKSA